MDNEKLIENIFKITSNNNIVNYKILSLQKFASKYSSNKEKIFHFFIDNNRITSKSNFIFYYKCIYCDLNNKIKVRQLLRKINKNEIRCYHCRNKSDIKRSKHSKFMISNNVKTGEYIQPKKKIQLNLDQIIENSKKEFSKESYLFKENFNKKHLSKKDFIELKKRILSFNNGIFTDLSNYEYIPILKTNNQMKYTSVIRINGTDNYFQPNNPILKCDLCENKWKAKNIFRFKNQKKILCRDCSCTNKIFKIRFYKNILNEKILYQSKLEKKFIDYCNDNKIKVTNGPNINYYFDNKKRNYRVDFKVLNYLVEIKDYHKWHLDNIKSGKWDAKENAAKTYCKDNNLEFLFVTPKNWEDKLKILID